MGRGMLTYLWLAPCFTLQLDPYKYFMGFKMQRKGGSPHTVNFLQGAVIHFSCVRIIIINYYYLNPPNGQQLVSSS